MTRNELKEIIKECIIEIREDNEVISETHYRLLKKDIDIKNEEKYKESKTVQSKCKDYYCLSTNSYQIDSDNIKDRTRFFLDKNDAIIDGIEKICTNNSEPQKVVEINKKYLTKSVYLYKISGYDMKVAGHGSYDFGKYTIKEKIFEGSIKEIISKYNLDKYIKIK